MNGAVVIAKGSLDFLRYSGKPGSGFAQLAVVFGIILVVVLFVFIWAAFWRKPGRSRHSYYHSRDSADTPAHGLPRRRKRAPRFLRILRRHHRRRRRVRPANPTLADIGGLPPARQRPPSGP